MAVRHKLYFDIFDKKLFDKKLSNINPVSHTVYLIPVANVVVTTAQFPENTHMTHTEMNCKLLCINVSAKCMNVNVKVSLIHRFQTQIIQLL